MTNVRNCDRCGQAWKAKPDGFVDEALEIEMDAHREYCFVVGDSVRWTPSNDTWIDGVIDRVLGYWGLLVTSTAVSQTLRGTWSPGGQTTIGRSLARRSRPRFSPGDRVRWTDPVTTLWADCVVLACGKFVCVRICAVGPGWRVPSASVDDAVELVHSVVEPLAGLAAPRQRPLVAGDTVRWERDGEPFAWLIGSVVTVGIDWTSMTVTDKATGMPHSIGDKVNVYTRKLTRIADPAMPPRCQRCNNHPCLCERPMAPAVVHAPVCCGKPMRKTGMGDGWICDQKTGGSYCERFQGPNGVRTPSQWWRHSGTPARPEWMRALGTAYDAEPLAKPPTPVDGNGELRLLIARDTLNRLDHASAPFALTPIQRAAVAEHWSAELRAKMKVSEDARRQAAEDLRIAMTELYSEEWD